MNDFIYVFVAIEIGEVWERTTSGSVPGAAEEPLLLVTSQPACRPTTIPEQAATWV